MWQGGPVILAGTGFPFRCLLQLVGLQWRCSYPPPHRNKIQFSFLWRYSPNFGLGLPPWNSSFHFGFLDLRQSVALLGRVISSSQGLYLYTNTEKRTHTHTHTNTKHPCPKWDSNPRAKTVHALDRSATVTGGETVHTVIKDSGPCTLFYNSELFCLQRSQCSSVGRATGYGLDDRGVGVRVSVG
jgi:hypothetical protein